MAEMISKAKLKNLRALTRTKERDQAGVYLAEGLRLVRDAITLGANLEMLVFDKECFEESEKLRELSKAGDVLAFLAEPSDFKEISDTVKSQGVIAVVAKSDSSPRQEFSQAHATFLVLDNMRDPGNVGTLIRHAAAFDCSGIFMLKGCADPYNVKAVRASMGGIFTVPIEVGCDIVDVVELLMENRVWTYVADRSSDANPALAIDYAPKSAFVIGGETEGLQPYWGEQNAIKIAIAQTERIDSLNAAVAAAILLSHRYHREQAGSS